MNSHTPVKYQPEQLEADSDVMVMSVMCPDDLVISSIVMIVWSVWL